MNSKHLSERPLFKSKILEQDLINRFCKFCNFLPREWAGLVFVMGRSEKLTRDQFTSEHFVWIYQESCYTRSNKPGLQTLQLDKKHLQERHRIFRRDREPRRIPGRTHNVWATRAEFVSVVYECICSSTPKKNAQETS